MKSIFISILMMLLPILAAASSDESLFQIDSSWKNQDAKAVQMKDLAGHPTLMTMAFTSCKSACPLMVHDMKSYGDSLPAEQAKKLRFVLVSIDPERDTPEALKEFAKKMKLDDRWTLLTGPADDVRELAAVLGFQYKASKEEGFGHSTTIYFVDSTGEIRFSGEASTGRERFKENLKEVMKK